MFTMQAAMPTILQACCVYSQGNTKPSIQFNYINQNNDTVYLDDLTIEVDGKTPHEITMAFGKVIPTIVERFKINLNERYVMVCKVDTLSPEIQVTLKTVLLPVAMGAIRQWEESYRGLGGADT